MRVLRLGRLKRTFIAAALAAAVSFPVVAADADPRSASLLAWLDATAHKSGLPRSHVGDDRLENWTFTYDAAVTALARLAMGDVKNARRIVDFYIRTPQAFRLGGVIEAVNPASSALGEDYAVRTGSNLWLGIAAYHLFRATGDARYLRFAKLQADFAMSLQVNDPKDLNDGAVRLGPPGGDATVGDQHIQGDERLPAFFDIISTEHNLDAYALFGMIAREAPPSVKQYRRAQERVLLWLNRVAYDPAEGRFNRGASRTVDALIATDVQSWAVSALGPGTLDAFEPGAATRILSFADAHCVVTVPFTRVDGATVSVTGVDFIDGPGARSAGRPRMVSPEWTFELANAHHRVGDEDGRRQLIAGVFPAAVSVDGGLAFPYATLGDAPVGHDWNTPASHTLSAVGAAWGILALTGFDPLTVPATPAGRQR